MLTVASHLAALPVRFPVYLCGTTPLLRKASFSQFIFTFVLESMFSIPTKRCAGRKTK